MVGRKRQKRSGGVDTPKEDLARLARQYGPEAIVNLASIAMGEAESGSVRVAALRELLERGFGRPGRGAPGSDGQTVTYVIVDDGYEN